MFEWLRDTLANTSPSLSYRHTMIPSPFFQQQQQQQQQQNHKQKERFSSSDDNDGTDEESTDKSFYHNPYHSSGLMNYVDVPQQQYTNEHTYPTYLAQQQTSDTTNQTLDNQIHAKLLSLQQRGSQFQSSTDRQYDYAYRNRILPPTNPSFIPNIARERSNTNEEPSEEGKDNVEIPIYYSNQYPNLDEQFDFASVVFWYRNVMQSVKKIM
jgi:hypothetical protein